MMHRSNQVACNQHVIIQITKYYLGTENSFAGVQDKAQIKKHLKEEKPLECC